MMNHYPLKPQINRHETPSTATPPHSSSGKHFSGSPDTASTYAYDSSPSSSHAYHSRPRSHTYDTPAVYITPVAGQCYTSKRALTPSQNRRKTVENKPLTARQAAQRDYLKEQKEKAALRAQIKEDLERYSVPTPKKLVVPHKEKLAVSTRAKKPLTLDDIRDPESICGMKCQLDLDREAWARSKALKLMSQTKDVFN
jgi:hypothetical protein